MGGLAIKSAPTRRYSKDEFLDIKEEVTKAFEEDFKRVAVPYYYNNKEEFGDLDVLVANDDVDILEMRGYINKHFSPNEFIHNNDCWTFDHKEFQIDVVLVPEEHFDTKHTYMSYNDLGNLMGVIAKGFGVKYGEMGLTKDVFYGEQKIVKNLIISKDYNKIFSFLGLSFDEWKKGFDDIEDIFRFVYSSDYFNGENYEFKNLNKINRNRNKKRPVYMNFLEWIKKQPEKKYKFEEDKTKYLDHIDDHFPESNFKERLREAQFQEAKKQYISSKLNVKTLLRRHNVPSDRKYGHFFAIALHQFKDSFASEKNFEDFVTFNDRDEILERFDEFLDQKEDLTLQDLKSK